MVGGQLFIFLKFVKRPSVVLGQSYGMTLFFTIFPPPCLFSGFSKWVFMNMIETRELELENWGNLKRSGQKPDKVFP